MSERPHKPKPVHLKIGESEFSGDISAADVLALCRQWLERVRAAPGGENLPSLRFSSVPDNPTYVSSEIVGRAYSTATGKLLLKEIPAGKATPLDTLLMLLWGFRRQMDRHHVPAVMLTDSARASGLKLGRIDRVLSAHPQYVSRTGIRKGTRYCLTDSGAAYVTRRLVELFR